MNLKQPKKLKLNRETLAELGEPQQTLVQGGMQKPTATAFSCGPFNPCYTIWTCGRGTCPN